MLARWPFCRAVVLAALVMPLAGCPSYDSPPRASIVGLNEFGKLPDPTAPVAIAFHEPIDYATLRFKILRFDETNKNPEGELFDEDAENAGTTLTTLYEHNGPGSFVGGTTEIDAERRVVVIRPDAGLLIGPPLAAVIEPGLSDDRGNSWKVRQILPFSYQLSCAEGGKPSAFPSAIHFMLAEVNEPISSQLQLLGDIRVDPATGTFAGQFTNADRDPDVDCGLACGSEDVCRTLPAPECVEPSARAATPEEYPDFAPNETPPTGYSFTVTGCIVDQPDGTFLFANNPVDVVVQSPPVTVDGVIFNAIFAFDEAGVLRGSGSFEGAEVALGVTPFGPGKGSMQTRTIPSAEVKPGIPEPPCMPEAVEACPDN